MLPFIEACKLQRCCLTKCGSKHHLPCAHVQHGRVTINRRFLRYHQLLKITWAPRVPLTTPQLLLDLSGLPWLPFFISFVDVVAHSCRQLC